jgi:hypothetical protein
MPSDRASLLALRDLIADTDLTLETIPGIPQNRTAHYRENLSCGAGPCRSFKQQPMTAAASLGQRETAPQPTSSERNITDAWLLRERRVQADGSARILRAFNGG